MFSRRLKSGYFALEGLNSFATVYYFYYFYFFMQKEFGFGNKANLILAALNGAIYAVMAWWGGKFSQRFGYFRALKLGFAIMLTSQIAGVLLHSAAGQILVMCFTVVGMCFTWPTLEALVSEGEDRRGLQHMVGVYNVVWAGTGAVAYFSGGAMLETLGFKSLFYVPIAVLITQLGLTVWLESHARNSPHPQPPAGGQSESLHVPAGADPKKFLRMAWLANPFAYITINTLIAVMPGVATRLGLSTMLAGFYCSVWCFARVGAFCALWVWPDWHYRFRWLLISYLALIGSFVAILTANNLLMLLVAQVVFGGAVGLIYYSSLFYAMDVGETKGEHGGIHEAAIGIGNFAGPAVGAASVQLLHGTASAAIGVSALLLCGLIGLMFIWRSGKR
jgi:predicted MFS family arabinose efflux permease